MTTKAAASQWYWCYEVCCCTQLSTVGTLACQKRCMLSQDHLLYVSRSQARLLSILNYTFLWNVKNELSATHSYSSFEICCILTDIPFLGVTKLSSVYILFHSTGPGSVPCSSCSDYLVCDSKWQKLKKWLFHILFPFFCNYVQFRKESTASCYCYWY